MDSDCSRQRNQPRAVRAHQWNRVSDLRSRHGCRILLSTHGVVQRVVRCDAWPKRSAAYARYVGATSLLARHRDRGAVVPPVECCRIASVGDPIVEIRFRQFGLIRRLDPWPHFVSRFHLIVQMLFSVLSGHVGMPQSNGYSWLGDGKQQQFVL